MVRNVIIHIGRHKTGSSSIQRALAENSSSLRESGVFYPTLFGRNHSHFIVSAFHPAPTKLNGGAIAEPEAALRDWSGRMLEKMREEIAARPTETLILSGEDASILPESGVLSLKRALDEMCGGSQYTVIMYTRHPVARALSAIQQNVKGNGMSIRDAVAFQLTGAAPTYRQILEAYSDVFGESAMRLRSFERATSARGGLLMDFASLCDIEIKEGSFCRTNESIPAEIVHFISSLYEKDSPQGHKIKWNRQFRVVLTKKDKELLFGLRGGGAPDYLARQDVDRIFSLHADDMELLSERFDIHYTMRMQDEGTVFVPLFSEPFLQQADRILPLLSAPAREEFASFLERRGSGSAGGGNSVSRVREFS